MTRDDILEAAAQAFRQKGYHGASMSDIAEAVNLQKASLYHHVASKQEILLALLDRAIELLIEQIAPIAHERTSAEARLRAMIRAYLNLLSENGDLASVLLFEHRSLEPKQHLRHIPNRDKFEALWREVVKEGVKVKAFSHPNPALAVRALLGSLNWTLTWYSPDGPLSMDEIASQIADLHLRGLSAR